MRVGPPPVIDRLAWTTVLSITSGVLGAPGLHGWPTVAATVVAMGAVVRGCWLVAVACASLAWGAFATHAHDAHLQDVCVDGVTRILRGRVHGLPREQGGVRRFDFDVETVTAIAGCSTPGPRRLRLAWYDGPALVPGDAWVLEVRLRALRNFDNPGAFDYVRWARDQGIDASGTVRRGIRDPAAPMPRALGAIHALRDAIARAIAAAGVEHAGVLAALAVGDARGIDRDTWELFRRTGTIHLLVISGLHVVIAAGCGFWLGRAAARLLPGRLRRSGDTRPAAIGAAATTIGYAALAGFSLPVVRACVMAVLGLAWWLSGRRLPADRACVTALAVLLVVEPRSILDQSLWLSFGATAVLVLYFAPRRGLPWTSGWLRVQGVMFAAMLPLLAATVGQVAWVAPITNLFAVPLVSAVAVPLVLAAMALLVPAPSLASWCLVAADRVCDLLLAGLARFGEAPTAFVADAPSASLALAFAAGIGLLLPLRPRDRAWLVPLTLLALYRAPSSLPPGQARVIVLDVGQGLAAVVDTTAHRLLYDAGPRHPSGFDLGEAVVVPALLATGPARLDLLVVSHDDVDHRGGVGAVLRRVPTLATLAGDAIPAPACRRGQSWQWDGVVFVVLHPATTMEAGNDASCVLSIRARGGRVLLPGDVSAAAESRLAADEDAVAADLLVAAHHGSRSSSAPAFLRAVAPRVVAVSAGHRNRFGHPHRDVVARIESLAVTWGSTAEGALVWRSVEPGVLSRWAVPSRRATGTPPGDG